MSKKNMQNLVSKLRNIRILNILSCALFIGAFSTIAIAKNTKSNQNSTQEAQSMQKTQTSQIPATNAEKGVENSIETNTDTSSNESKTKNDFAQATLTNSPKKEHIVGGVAIKVNGDPITLYEIKTIQKQRHFDKEKAVEFLIAQRLKTQEIERLKINVDDDRLDREIENIATQNQMNMQQFMLALKREGIEYDMYRDELKDQIETRELMRNVLLSAETSSEDEIHRYYNEHKSEFSTPKEVEVARYTSKNPKLLERTIANPNTSISGVEKTQEKLELSALNPQIAQLFSSLREGRFTPVLDAGGGSYVTFRVVKKIGKNVMNFDEARHYIAQKLSQNNQEKVLSEYFEKIKQKAHIQTLREP